MTTTLTSSLALLGGTPLIREIDRHILDWPLLTNEHKRAMVEVMDRSAMSEWDVTMQFEQAYARYNGVEHALAYPNGTAALQAAMFAVGLGRGDEIIAPSFTYWASISPAMTLGAVPVFADIDPHTLCIDAKSIEKRISPYTRAIVAVHYNAHACDMDTIMSIARRHRLKVIEDVSRAQGSMYKGQMCGSLGDVAAMSMMTRKSFAIGEGGMLLTRQRELYERAVCFSHYERHASEVHDPQLAQWTGMPLGGVKGRLNQLASACGLVEVDHYPRKVVEIQRAMRRFAEMINTIPGLCMRELESGQGTMGGWYYPVVHYDASRLGGLPLEVFGKAVTAEGAFWMPLPDHALHLHPVMNQADIYHDGKPTRIAFAQREVREPLGSLPVAETIRQRAFCGPWFKHDWTEVIEQHAAAYRKVAEQADQLRAVASK